VVAEAFFSTQVIRKRTSKKELFEFVVHAHTPKAVVPKRRMRETATRNGH
jgi:hypothetical protein